MKLTANTDVKQDNDINLNSFSIFFISSYLLLFFFFVLQLKKLMLL